MATTKINRFKENGLLFIEELCHWMDKNKETPKTSSLNPSVKKMAYRLGNMRQARQGHNPHTKFHRAYDILATKLGYKGLFHIGYVFPKK